MWSSSLYLGKYIYQLNHGERAVLEDDPFMQSIGARLRALRRARGLSQRALAAKAGVTHATISMIESGRTNPSLGALRRVLNGVPTSLAEFFAEPGKEDEKPPVFFAEKDLVEVGSGLLSLRQVGSSSTNGGLQILVESYAPGADTGRVMLSHDAHEGGVIIEGRVEITVGHDMRTLHEGESYLFDSRTPHRFRNPYSETCRVISACTPPTF